MNRRLKVLISAYACSPYKGSEPGVGWGFVSELAKHHDLWVIVEEEKFREDIERWLKENPDRKDSIHFYFFRKKRNRILRKIWPPSYYWYYRRWHKDARDLAEKLHSKVGFDLAHQLTMVGFREPGYLWQLDIPFVWGPVGGIGLFPWRFLPTLGLYGAFYYFGYNLFNLMHMNFMTRPREAARKAGAGLFMATPENRTGAMQYWECPSTVIPEVGLPRDPEENVCERKENEPLCIVWTGLHIHRKALNLALDALHQLPDDLNWQLDVLGAGPKTVDWQKLAEDYGIQDRCHFHGWLPREEALDIMSNGHLMLITSLRDLTSTVIIEALALSLPVVTLDHCGFSYVIDETCGIKISVTSPKQVSLDMAGAIEKLARDESYRQKLAEGALNRSADFSWQRKAAQVNEIYLKALHKQ